MYLPPDRSPDKCWEWQGTMASVGYGQVTFRGQVVYAHRLSWELANGRQPLRNEQIRHSCDNRRCVNPAHLSNGTFYDNMQDAVARNRFKHAEHHWSARLTANDVRTIRELGAAGMRHQEIADKYNMCRSAITNIINRKTWRQL